MKTKCKKPGRISAKARTAVLRRRCTGKIARLPLEARNYVNHALSRGLPYQSIVTRLAEMGHPGIITRNLFRWFRGPFAYWAENQIAFADNTRITP